MLELDKIHCGDNCDLMGQLPRECIDLVVTSPPYDDLRSYLFANAVILRDNLTHEQKSEIIAELQQAGVKPRQSSCGVYCLNDIPKHLRKHFKPAQASWDFFGVAWQLKRVLKPGGVIVWVVGDATKDGSETGSSMEQALHFKRLGLNLHDTMVWSKGGFSQAGDLSVRYGQTWEYCFVISAGKPKTWNPLLDRPNKWAGTGKHGTIRNRDGSMKPVSNPGRNLADTGIRFNVWDVPAITQPDTGEHPAVFPFALARDHIASWSNPGDLVLDPFCGSGTTAKAAKELGRRFLGLEINPEYCAIAERRIAQQMLEIEGESRWAETAETA